MTIEKVDIKTAEVVGEMEFFLICHFFNIHILPIGIETPKCKSPALGVNGLWVRVSFVFPGRSTVH